MQSKNKRRPDARESAYLSIVKMLPCSVCNASGPSDIHEPRQGKWWLVCALCRDCHNTVPTGQKPRSGSIWAVKKMDVWDAIGITLSRVVGPLLAVRGVLHDDH